LIAVGGHRQCLIGFEEVLIGFEEQMSDFRAAERCQWKRGQPKCVPNLHVSNSLVATLATRAENGGLHRVMRAEKMPSFALRPTLYYPALRPTLYYPRRYLR
jgi:hypothetical protein